MIDLERWRGKVAIVTGASSGIGAAVVRRLAQAGMRVAASARRAERLDALRQELDHTPGEVLPVAGDLRDPAAIDALFRAVRDTWGGVQVMVNNAGIGRAAPLMSGATEDWREMLELNVLSLCICTREALADMQRQGEAGHIIHISSMAGHRVPSGAGVYAATKHAVRALTEGLRVELREAQSDIRVTAISPGLVETEFASNYFRDEEKAAQTYDRYKVLESEDIVDAVAYVLGAPAHCQVHDVLLRPTRQPN